LSDGIYIPVQAKGRSSLSNGEVHFVVRANSLNDDNALIVGGLVTEGGLGPTMLVVSEGEFKHLAIGSTTDGLTIYSAAFGMRPRSYSHWLPYLVPTDRLIERFGVSPSEAAAPVVAPIPLRRSEERRVGKAGKLQYSTC